MKALLLSGVLAIALVGAPALAAQTPRPGTADPRIKVVDYDPWQVYQVVGAFRTATQIIFSPQEEILHVALGDTVGWEVAAETNILFVKPREKTGATNLIVTTKRAGETRNYTFELRTRSGPISASTPDTYFQVRFRYPEEERVRQALAAQRGAVQTALDIGVTTGVRNLNYTVQGSSKIQPSEVSDNGQFTVLRFPGQREMPTIYTVSPDGSEALVPFDVRGEFVVIHGVSPQLRLRRGREVLCIYNEAVQPYGVNYGTATGSPIVKRTQSQGGTR
ncbi:MAG: P-type conjugative transfer protein VirB9 [Phenylobacterium sp.]|uniref:P-type conjugative transfer protein VirB9 n=1 Tax=Phenylobacterium sp. TaxID=1871053 RepID=UPI00185B7ED6|nr:P-type conjugative transfer protein VirB9 [Phenylobacterium sp.]MBA4794541.1 P-type conjugative transfer protein VirB9 [Phenylobacterium sp.]